MVVNRTGVFTEQLELIPIYNFLSNTFCPIGRRELYKTMTRLQHTKQVVVRSAANREYCSIC